MLMLHFQNNILFSKVYIEKGIQVYKCVIISFYLRPCMRFFFSAAGSEKCPLGKRTHERITNTLNCN